MLGPCCCKEAPLNMSFRLVLPTPILLSSDVLPCLFLVSGAVDHEPRHPIYIKDRWGGLVQGWHIPGAHSCLLWGGLRQPARRCAFLYHKGMPKLRLRAHRLRLQDNGLLVHGGTKTTSRAAQHRHACRILLNQQLKCHPIVPGVSWRPTAEDAHDD